MSLSPSFSQRFTSFNSGKCVRFRFVLGNANTVVPFDIRLLCPVTFFNHFKDFKFEKKKNDSREMHCSKKLQMGKY